MENFIPGGELAARMERLDPVSRAQFDVAMAQMFDPENDPVAAYCLGNSNRAMNAVGTSLIESLDDVLTRQLWPAKGLAETYRSPRPVVYDAMLDHAAYIDSTYHFRELWQTLNKGPLGYHHPANAPDAAQACRSVIAYMPQREKLYVPNANLTEVWVDAELAVYGETRDFRLMMSAAQFTDEAKANTALNLHVEDLQDDALAFDLPEPLRPMVGRAIIDMVNTSSSRRFDCGLFTDKELIKIGTDTIADFIEQLRHETPDPVAFRNRLDELGIRES